ncbi:MAG: hypothetical protein FJX76_07195 [Armatimonadetes bacterium]|nr:hypothetical protein [Armatimonadota bacterium]
MVYILVAALALLGLDLSPAAEGFDPDVFNIFCWTMMVYLMVRWTQMMGLAPPFTEGNSEN